MRSPARDAHACGLRLLQAEVAALETELSDPTNPLLRKEKEAGHADPGELIRGMVDVKRRIEKISKAREGRGEAWSASFWENTGKKSEEGAKEGPSTGGPAKGKVPEVRDIAEMDRRVGELEKLVGSSSAALDEVGWMCALPPCV
ncbi:hypothetical protein NUW54_g14244 [Trametes sanguinea]|uniref:Uncharacterized protein n=1 Tax=Trametes sanguinea TaxID=158606 RepID=A0ACC1MFP6_9APHY|nr:hypothetical protein NUW54_g14244 [Trametes sanguinea]